MSLNENTGDVASEKYKAAIYARSLNYVNRSLLKNVRLNC